MNCKEATDSLLIADPAELNGIGRTPVAQHVRNCAECRRRAELILAETEALAASLAAISKSSVSMPSLKVDGKQPKRRVRISAAAWAALPLAAAIGSVLLVRDVQPRPRLQPPDLSSVRRPVSEPIVNAPTDRDCAVIKAGDRITVVWYGSKLEGS